MFYAGQLLKSTLTNPAPLNNGQTAFGEGGTPRTRPLFLKS